MGPVLGAVLPAAVSGIAGLIGSIFNRNSANEAADKNAAAQREFAQNGIRWKVEDAKAAGLHPLAALGAQTTSFAPSYVGDTSVGQAMASAGQDISRAMVATADSRQRAAVSALALERAGLENELLRAQILKTTTSIGPPMPSVSGSSFLPGQGNSGLVVDKPLERTTALPGVPNAEPGAVTDIGYTRTVDGGFAPVMSNDAKQRLEEDWIGMLTWNLRNRLLPSFQMNMSPPSAPLMPGYAWVYNPLKQQYEPMRKFTRSSDPWGNSR